jgi:hypothetical protein
MATEEQRTSSVVRVPAEPEIAAELVVVVVPGVRAALAVPEDQVVPAVLAALAVPENPVALVAPGDQVVPVAPESPVELVAPGDPVVPENPAELELVPVAVELELVRVEAVQEHDRVEVPLRTRSVIAAHHRGRVPVPRVEDSVAVVETTPEQAATEAAAAWAAAV